MPTVEMNEKSNLDKRLAALNSMPNTTADEIASAKQEAQEIKKMLTELAKKHSILGTSVELQANELISIMFNRFRTQEFDTLHDELAKVSPAPIKPMRMDPES